MCVWSFLYKDEDWNYYLPLLLVITVSIICVLHHLSCHRAALEESAYGRIKQVLRWYLSGFYKKPKVRFLYYYTRLLIVIIVAQNPDYMIQHLFLDKGFLKVKRRQ